MAKLLLGKEVNASINEEIKAKVEKLKAQDITPALGIIRIGEREDDIAYEKSAAKRCETLGVAYEKFLLPADVKEEEVLKTISQVNKNDKIHGVLLFRPLPKHLNEDRIVNALAVEKDVDGITDLSMAGVFMGKDMGYAPCTPSACMKVLDYAKSHPQLLVQMIHSKKLPLAQLAAGSGTERKTLERHRKYLVAILLAYTNGFEIIRGHLQFMKRKEKPL